MTPTHWLAGALLIFILGFTGQVLRRRRLPWLVPLVAAIGFYLLAAVFTNIVLPAMGDALMGGVHRAAGKSQ